MKQIEILELKNQTKLKILWAELTRYCTGEATGNRKQAGRNSPECSTTATKR